MNSDADVYVWIHLPYSAEPVVCGRYERRRVPGGTVGTFVYGKSYLARPDAIAIDPVLLPLKDQAFTTTHLSGWFSVLLDAAPDDWGRRLIDRLHGPQEEIQYLCLSRGEHVGALSFSDSAGTTPAAHDARPDLLSLDRLLDLHRAIEAGEDVADEDRELLLQGTSAGGARPKTTIEDDESLWLAKFPSARDSPGQPPVPMMEGALLSVAEACDIRVPRHRVVDVAGAPVLLVERFDRERLDDGRFARRQYASARTLLWSRPEIQQYSYQGSYTNLVGQMRAWERAPTDDIRALYRRIVFNCLVGNTDDHDQNTGFVCDEEGFFVLSPAFDLTARPATARMFLAMPFGADGAAVTLDNLLSETRVFGYTKEQALALVRAQWRALKSQLVKHLLANGCSKSLAASALAAMPGHRLVG